MNMDNVKSVHRRASISADDLQAQRLAVSLLDCHRVTMTLTSGPEN
jgi:hypothetical protein